SGYKRIPPSCLPPFQIWMWHNLGSPRHTTDCGNGRDAVQRVGKPDWKSAGGYLLYCHRPASHQTIMSFCLLGDALCSDGGQLLYSLAQHELPSIRPDQKCTGRGFMDLAAVVKYNVVSGCIANHSAQHGDVGALYRWQFARIGRCGDPQSGISSCWCCSSYQQHKPPITLIRLNGDSWKELRARILL